MNICLMEHSENSTWSTVLISVQLMDPNCKPIHERTFNVPISLQQGKEIVRLVDIGVLEEDYSSEWASPSFAIPKKRGTIRVVNNFRKLNLLLKLRMSPISYSKDWGHDPFNVRVYLCFSIGLKYGLLSHQIRC
jgi:hypothetical protein